MIASPLWSGLPMTLAVGIGLIAGPARSAAPPLVSAIKATYLVKFGSYVTWPSIAENAPFAVCVVGDPVLSDVVESAAKGQQVAGHPVSVRRLDAIKPQDECQIVYLAGGQGQSVIAALQALEGAPVLTVTDGPHAPARGTLHFDVRGGRVRFHVDSLRAEKSKLIISSKLLALAVSVRGRSR